MKNLLKAIIIAAVISASPLYADDANTFSINAAPRMMFPVGESSEYFTLGFGGSLSFDYQPDLIPLLFGRIQIEYDYMPIVTKDGFSMITFSAGPGIRYCPFDELALSAMGTAGYYFGSITDGSGTPGGNLALSGGISAMYNIVPAFSIGLSGDFSWKSTLMNGIGVTLRSVIHPGGFKAAGPLPVDQLESLIPGASGNGLDVERVQFNQVFPVMFKYYDNHPIGTVSLLNNSNSPMTDVSIEFDVNRYMDNPKQTPIAERIEGGESADFDIYALFSDNVLEITEGTKVSSTIILRYRQGRSEQARKYTVSMNIYDRNAITWDDDRKAAAFVTAKDPAVLQYAKNVSGWAKDLSPSAIDRNLCIAMGIHNALKQSGINYQVDPKTPFTEFSADSLSVDFLQFPRQTLSYTSGDCDDLSILYASLLEAVGIETAFITVPGHIFAAFALNMSPVDAKRTFLKPEDLIITENKVWIPIEVTLVQDEFLTAWAEGAKEWREYDEPGKAQIYPMHDSWTTYQPVGLIGEAVVELPKKPAVDAAFSAELNKFIEREIYPKVEKYRDQISRSNGASKYVNRLGVLYARYGLNDKAEEEFSKILDTEEYVPTLINMGNLRFLQQNIKSALEYYERAADMEPENPTVLVATARANHELENYGSVKESYNLLKEIAPETAEKFAYLELQGDEAARASNTVEQKEIVLWNEN